MQKNALIIFIICVALILIGAYLMYQPVKAPSNGSTAATAVEVPFQVLKTGTEAVAASTRKNIRLTDSNQLASAWEAVHGKKETPPAIDFSKNEVYVIYDGKHDTEGYSVSVKKIIEADGTRTVSIVHAAPDPTCKMKKKTVSPFQFVTVPASSANLTHTDENATVACK